MNWEVKKRSEVCLKCEKKFSHNEEYFSLLFFSKKELLRNDFCLSCWNLQNLSPEAFFWKGKYQQKENKEEKTDKKKLIEEIFKEYLHSTDKQQTKYCYIMALMLERKRIIAEKNKNLNRQNSNKKLIIYEHTKTGEVFVLKDPEIDLIEIGPLQREINEILKKRGLADGKL